MRIGSAVSAMLGFMVIGCSAGDTKLPAERSGAQAQALSPSDFHELRPSGDPAGPANFGWSVAMDGDWAVVGANRVAGTLGSEGAAYVLERGPGGDYVQRARLRSTDSPAQAAQFGYAVALSGDLALVGAPYFDHGSVANPGAAYVFRRDAVGSWNQQARLLVAAQPNSYFGYAAAVGAEHVFVSAWGYNRVHVYERHVGAPTPSALLSPPDAVFGDRFGAALAASQSRLIVGAPYAGGEAGAAYVYELAENDSWILRSKLTGTVPGARFGRAVAILGDSVLVGSQNRASRFTRGVSGDWTFKEDLTAPNTGFDYGVAVGLTPLHAIVGAYLADAVGKKDAGAGYLFTQDLAGNYGAAERFAPPASAATDYFGYSVATSGGRAIVGAYGNDMVAANGGAAYVVDLGGTPNPCGPGTPCASARDLLPCGTYRLSASQTTTEEGDKLSVGYYDFGRRAKLKLPATIRITSSPAGLAGYLYFRDPSRRQDVRCRYLPPTPAATTWVFDGCKIPRAGVAAIHTPGTIVEASEVRFRLGGGDALENGPTVAGDIDLVEGGSCNAFSMEDCEIAVSTASRFSPQAERYENARLEAPRSFSIPASVPVISVDGARQGQRAELAFWNGATRTTSCSYEAMAPGATQLALLSCSGGFGAGSSVNGDRIVLRLLVQGFRGKPVSARVSLSPLNQSCVQPSADGDSDNITTLVELAKSRGLGVADVDADGLANWKDADADGDGLPDGTDGVGDANANGVSDFVDRVCQPIQYFADTDADGFGDALSVQLTCPAPAGFVQNAQDCDDNDAAINPEAAELCGDDVDNDCDVVVDETCTPACPVAPQQGEGSLLSQLQAGHGFSANAGGLHDLDDAVDFTIGSQSAWIETNAAGAAKTLKRSNLGTFDFTGKMPRLWVKLDDTTTASSLQLYLGNNNLADQYKFSFNSSQGQQWTTNGDWVGFSMSWSSKHVSTVGSPNRAAITDVQLRAIDTASGNPVKLHANQFSMVDEPADYPNGVLSFTFDDGFASQYTLAKPILDTYGYPATAYIIIDKVGSAGFMSLADLTDAEDNANWEIAYHSYDSDIHTTGFPATPQLDLEQDIDLARDWLYQNGFEGYCDCAYPHGSFTGSTDVLGAVQTKLSTCRTVHQKHREAFPPSHAYKLRVLLVNLPITVATVQAAMDQAKLNKEWIILVFHNFTDTPLINNDYDPDDFEAIVDYANTIGIPVKTVDEMMLP